MKQKFFEYAQPKQVEVLKYSGDCVIRAITLATGKPYKEVYEAARSYGWRTRYKNFSRAAENKMIQDTLEHFGLKVERVNFPAVKGQPRMKTRTLPKGKFVCSMAGHLAYCKDNVVYDTEDNSMKCVYWAFKIL